MRKTLVVVVLCSVMATLGVFGPLSYAADQWMAIPGTPVELLQPEGFEFSKEINGFQQKSTGSSVNVAEMQAPMATVLKSFENKNDLAQQGISIISKEEVTVDHLSGVLLGMSQSANGVENFKWELILGHNAQSVMIMATFKKENQDALSDLLKKTILTAKVDFNKRSLVDNSMPFSVDELGGFKNSHFMNANILMLSIDGKPPQTENDPIITVNKYVGSTKNVDLEQASKVTILRYPNARNVQIEENNPITVDGFKGYEAIGSGLDNFNNAPMSIYQAILFTDDTYYLIWGFVSTKQFEKYLDIFKKTARTLKEIKS